MPHDAAVYTKTYNLSPAQTKALVEAAVRKASLEYRRDDVNTLAQYRTLTGQATPAPTLTSLTPNTKVSDNATFSVAVGGTNFQPWSIVVWNGAPVQTVYNSATSLTATAPAVTGAAVHPVYVTSGGDRVTAPLNFTFTAPVPPVVTSLNPATAPADLAAPNITITVTGTGFVAGSQVYWQGTQPATTYTNATTLSFTVPKAVVAGPVAMSVSNDGGTTFSNSVDFTFTDPVAERTPDSAWLKADIVSWLLEKGVDLDEAALNNLTKAELLSIVQDVLSPAPPE